MEYPWGSRSAGVCVCVSCGGGGSTLDFSVFGSCSVFAFVVLALGLSWSNSFIF